MFRFAEPAFLALLILPLTLALWPLARHFLPGLARWSGRHLPASPSITVPTLAGAGRLPATAMGRLRPLVRLLKLLALACLILALARPQTGQTRSSVLTEGINIVLAVDVSGSMEALDFRLDGEPVTRLEAVKAVVREFVKHRAGDRIGLVAFGSEAYTQIPLTRDYDALVRGLNLLRIGSAGKQTAVGDALGMSVKRIADVASVSNVVILLTDGRSNTGLLTPEEATRAAAARGVKVHTIGVGGDAPAPFIVDQPLFGRRVVRQAVDLDEETLTEIAQATGGTYHHAQDSETLAKVYEAIDSLETSEAEVVSFDEYDDHYPGLLFTSFLALCCYILLSRTRFLEVP